VYEYARNLLSIVISEAMDYNSLPRKKAPSILVDTRIPRLGKLLILQCFLALPSPKICP